MGIVNPLTGEAVLDGTDVHIIYTAEAFIEIQQVLGLGIMDLVGALAQGQHMGFVEAQVLVRSGMEAWRRRTGAGGQPVTPAKALKTIQRAGGLMKVWLILVDSIKAAPDLGLRDDDSSDGDEDDGSDPGTGSGQ